MKSDYAPLVYQGGQGDRGQELLFNLNYFWFFIIRSSEKEYPDLIVPLSWVYNLGWFPPKIRHMHVHEVDILNQKTNMSIGVSRFNTRLVFQL